MSYARKAPGQLVVSIFLAACSGGGGAPKTPTQPVVTSPVLTTVAVSLSAATVQVGWTDTARAAGFDQRGAPISIDAPVWTTSSGAIATVDAHGVVTGATIGQAFVIATVGGKQGQVALPVVPVAVATVAVDPPAAGASPGETVQLAATMLDAAGDTLNDRTVTWSSTRTAVATVSPTGMVTGISAGTAIIVASSGDQSGGAVVTVTGPLPPGVTVSIATPVPGQIVGDTLRVHAVAASAYAIEGIVATVGTLMAPLAPAAKNSWEAKILLNGTYYGTFEVILTATDANGVIGIDSVGFTRIKMVLGGSSPSPKKKRILPLVPVKVP